MESGDNESGHNLSWEVVKSQRASPKLELGRNFRQRLCVGNQS